MSVPLPSPSTLSSTTAKTIPRARPAPINLEPVPEPHSPSSLGQSPRGIRGSGSRDRRGSRGATTALGQSPGNDVNWRERTMGAGSPKKGKAPERTVGGFGKKEVVAGAGTGGPAGGAISAAAKDAASKLGAEKAAALAHVPCRFYKAGSCTAGDGCPFSHEGGGKKDVCQWFLKGNCKFGHKCALAHLRPGEPISMDRKNKKMAQMESKGERPAPVSAPIPGSAPPISTPPSAPAPPPSAPPPASDETPAAPVPIRSALSSSLQAPPGTAVPRQAGSSPMREPYGPPSGVGSGSPSGGFLGRSPGAFGASPNRPSPLSASFSARLAVPGALALKGSPTTAIHASRQPVTAGPTAGFSSSLSHPSLLADHSKPPLSASLADGSYLRRSIWAHSEKPDEPLSPRRPIMPPVSRSRADVFDEDEDDHGEDLLPSSLSDLLTPMERARRMSRRDSNDYFGASPARSGGSYISPNPKWTGERLAQSAGAAMGPAGFQYGLWTPSGADLRQGSPGGNGAASGFSFAPASAVPAPPPRQSLLSEQLSPVSPLRTQNPTFAARPAVPTNGRGNGELANHLVPPFFSRVADPSSPSARALSEHAPGMSLPGGVATALSRLHLQGETDEAKANGARGEEERREQGGHADEREEEMFAMDG